MFPYIQSIGGSLPGMGPIFDDSVEAPIEGATEPFPGDQLITDLVYHIFTFLPPKGLGCALCVSKAWREIASTKSIWDRFDREELYPRLRNKGQAFWEERYDLVARGLDFEGISSLAWSNHLTCEKLSELAQHPKKGHPTQFRDITDTVLRRLREIPPSKACIVVLSNNVLSGGRNKSAKVQEEMVRGIGGEMPEVLPGSALAILTHNSSTAHPPNSFI